ncbi:SDR family NAD(P)-dependent oxidoreductase [Devosia sp.]|uniref:SDR family NAD(P)-dependent oxidoreductase n=1 Tax=Devosia sp. TaxID=1871048 RepID=UPI002FC66D24
MRDINNAVCLVTGASRGVGRGIALALLAAGARVHVTARTVTDAQAAVHPQLEGSLDGLVAEAAALPGTLTIHVCDHAEDAQTEAAVAKTLAAEGRIDILVNNAWPGYERMEEHNEFTWILPFWEQPMWRWHAMIDTGLRAAFVASRAAAADMVRRRSGLIVNISYWAAQRYYGNAIYGVAKAAIDKMTADCAHELRPHGVAAISLYPGLVRTEAVLRNAQYFDMTNSESPRFIGMVVAGLWRDAALMDKTGCVHVAAALAQEYAIADVDGKHPIPAAL